MCSSTSILALSPPAVSQGDWPVWATSMVSTSPSLPGGHRLEGGRQKSQGFWFRAGCVPQPKVWASISRMLFLRCPETILATLHSGKGIIRPHCPRSENCIIPYGFSTSQTLLKYRIIMCHCTLKPKCEPKAKWSEVPQWPAKWTSLEDECGHWLCVWGFLELVQFHSQDPYSRSSVKTLRLLT